MSGRIGKENYREYTDKYFLRTKEILEKEKINPIVRYQLFAREGLDEIEGINEAIGFIRDVAEDKVKIYSLLEGERYLPDKVIMKLEGRVQDVVELETVYLGILSGRNTKNVNFQKIKENAKAIVDAAEEKKVFYFGARHFHWEYDERIAEICKEQGFIGCSTDVGAKAWNAKGIGTMPHALIMCYASLFDEKNINKNPTVEAAKAFDKNISEKVPRIVLIDAFNREIDDTIKTAESVTLSGVRIDTCGENYIEGSEGIELSKLDVSEKYLEGKGVKIKGVWALKKALIENGFGNLEITVSSGFNAEKTAAFMKADKLFKKEYGVSLFDSIGTGSIEKPFMVTSDIVAYFNERKNSWSPMVKKGRAEIKSEKLEEVK